MSCSQSDSIVVNASNGHAVEFLLWQDKKCVPFLNTFTNPVSVTTVTRRNKDGIRTDVTCPMAIKLYNKFMGGGIDLADQRHKTYSTGRKSKKWWMPLFNT